MHVCGIAIKRVVKAPLIPVESAVITLKDGIVGDCRGTGGTTRKRQLTAISLQQWDLACREISVTLPFHARRANLCIDGHIFSSQDVGKRLCFQFGAVLEITGETDPCARMTTVAAGLKEALGPEWRGGVTCRVIKEGVVRVGEDISIK